MKSDFIAINYMLGKVEIEKTKQYINKLNYKVDKIVLINYTNNILIESILYNYNHKLNKLNIDLIASVKISRDINNQLKHMGLVMVIMLDIILKSVNYSEHKHNLIIRITKNNFNYCFSIYLDKSYESSNIKKIKWLIKLLKIEIGKKNGLIDIISDENRLEIRYICYMNYAKNFE